MRVWLLEATKKAKKRRATGFKSELPHPVDHMHIVKMYDAADADTKRYGHEWYGIAHHIAKKLGAGHENGTHKAAGVLSAYSPRTNWSRNIMHAAKAMKNGTGHGGPGHGTLAAFGKQADRILKGEKHHDVLTGNKQKAFAHLIEHGGRHHENPAMHSDHVVVDRHAASVAMNTRLTDHDVLHGKVKVIWGRSKKSHAHYEHVADAYRKAAAHISQRDGVPVAPHQVQAVTWEHYRKINSIRSAKSGSGHGGKRVSKAAWVASQAPKRKRKGLKESCGGSCGVPQELRSCGIEFEDFLEDIPDLGRPFGDDEFVEDEP